MQRFTMFTQHLDPSKTERPVPSLVKTLDGFPTNSFEELHRNFFRMFFGDQVLHPEERRTMWSSIIQEGFLNVASLEMLEATAWKQLLEALENSDHM